MEDTGTPSHSRGSRGPAGPMWRGVLVLRTGSNFDMQGRVAMPPKA